MAINTASIAKRAQKIKENLMKAKEDELDLIYVMNFVWDKNVSIDAEDIESCLEIHNENIDIVKKAKQFALETISVCEKSTSPAYESIKDFLSDLLVNEFPEIENSISEAANRIELLKTLCENEKE